MVRMCTGSKYKTQKNVSAGRFLSLAGAMALLSQRHLHFGGVF